MGNQAIYPAIVTALGGEYKDAANFLEAEDSCKEIFRGAFAEWKTSYISDGYAKRISESNERLTAR